MQHIGYYLEQFQRYKKSIILLACGLTAGILLTSILQYFSVDSRPTQPSKSTDQAASGQGMRFGSSDGPVGYPPPLPPPTAAPFAPPAVAAQAPPRATAPQWVDVPAASLAPKMQAGQALSLPPNYTIVPSSQNASSTIGTMEYTESSNGYPVAVGRRAVDSFVPGGGICQAVTNGTGSNVILDPSPGSGSNVIQDPTPGLDVQNMPVSRNGLLGNPCCDPPSSHGRAYTQGSAQ